MLIPHTTRNQTPRVPYEIREKIFEGTLLPPPVETQQAPPAEKIWFGPPPLGFWSSPTYAYHL